MNTLSFPRICRSPSLIVAVVLTLSVAFPVQAWYPKCSQASAYPGYCCWTGTAPICTGGCPNGYGYNGTESKDAQGALSRCWTGTHKMCCPASLETRVGDGVLRLPDTRVALQRSRDCAIPMRRLGR